MFLDGQLMPQIQFDRGLELPLPVRRFAMYQRPLQPKMCEPPLDSAV